MIALIASALLGLYIFLPDFFFNRFASQFVAFKQGQRTKLEEITAGIAVALFPFAVAWYLTHSFYFFGHYPFFVDQADVAKLADYRNVFLAAYHEEYFVQHQQSVWDSLSNVWRHQARLLTWNYVCLAAEIKLVNLFLKGYGKNRTKPLYRLVFSSWLLNRVSEWHSLLTPFIYEDKNRRVVAVDVMTDDGHLYTGDIVDHFVNRSGELTGLLLKHAKRYQFHKLEADRKAGTAKNTAEYWKEIPGADASFYIPAHRIVTMNVRYPLADPTWLEKITEELSQILNRKAITVAPAAAGSDEPRQEEPPTPIAPAPS